MKITVHFDDFAPRDISYTPWARYADVIETIAAPRTKSGRRRTTRTRENLVVRWSVKKNRPPFDDCKIEGDDMLIYAFVEGMSDEQIAMCRD
ncbi:hypothetical protein [Acidisoma sp. 7E03]